MNNSGPSDEIPVSEDVRLRLREIRDGLLHLHKAIMVVERNAYERIHGRLESAELLRLLTDDAWFSWLRPLSEMVVQFDEFLELEEPMTSRTVNDLLREVRSLLHPSQDGEEFGIRYHEVLQQDPDAILAHAEVHRRLTACTVLI